MSGASWTAFAEALAAESRALGELGAAALEMTSALVFGKPADIEAANRAVDARRIAHAAAHSRRVAMMKSGFGDMSLRQVCTYAPPSVRRSVFGSLREMRTRATALQLTLSNNKTLINAGLMRVANTIAVVQRALAEQTGTYRRRGQFDTGTSSLIVSRKA